MTRHGSRVQVVGRAGCHLCEDVYDTVAQVCAARGESWVKVDLESDPALEPFRTLIPVVLVDGRQIAHWRLTAAELESALAR